MAPAQPGTSATWTQTAQTTNQEQRTKDRYKADPQHWDHVTGALIDITAIGEQFGLQFWRGNPSEPINHNVRTVIVDAAGHVQWITNENEWKADAFVEQMVKAAGAKPEPDAPASGARQP